MRCVICGEYIDQSGILRLTGGYHTTLCFTHRNQYHEYIISLPDWSKLNELEVMVKSYIQVGNAELAVKTMKDLTKHEAKLCKITRQWVEQQIERNKNKNDGTSQPMSWSYKSPKSNVKVEDEETDTSV